LERSNTSAVGRSGFEYPNWSITRIRNSAHNEVIALTLRELREEAGLTQVEVSKLADMTQSALSRLERREDNPIPALRQYVEAKMLLIWPSANPANQ
jgi:DNA-binding XRE family transcriptional regulator